MQLVLLHVGQKQSSGISKCSEDTIIVDPGQADSVV